MTCITMLSTLAVIGYLAVFMAPALCCRSKEYETRDGQCCPMCYEGTVVRKDCTLQSGTKCTPCASGTYMNKPNGLTSCFPCTPCDQGHGLLVQQECTSTRDTICDVLNGFFCKDLMDDTGCSSAQKHTRCESGHRIKTPGTSRTDTVCEPCPPGYFSLDGVNCTVWTTCSETQVKLTEGSTSSDVVCATASRHRVFYVPLISLSLLSLAVVGLVITGVLTSKKKSDCCRASGS